MTMFRWRDRSEQTIEVTFFSTAETLQLVSIKSFTFLSLGGNNYLHFIIV